MLRSAPDGVFYLVSRFVNFSKLCGTLFLIPKLLPVPNYQNKKKKRKKSWVCGASWHHYEAVSNYTMHPPRRNRQRRVGGWRDGGVKAHGVGSREDTDRDRKMSWEFLKPWRKCRRYFDDTHPCLLVWVLGGFILTQKNTEKICSTLSE